MATAALGSACTRAPSTTTSNGVPATGATLTRSSEEVTARVSHNGRRGPAASSTEVQKSGDPITTVLRLATESRLTIHATSKPAAASAAGTGPSATAASPTAPNRRAAASASTTSCRRYLPPSPTTATTSPPLRGGSIPTFSPFQTVAPKVFSEKFRWFEYGKWWSDP